MSLTLTIENMDSLENGEPTQLKLDRHGAVIGRSPHSDWSLPDPKNYVSSTHCEIDFRDGGYVLYDKSTNGTYVNDGTERMSGPHPLVDGDVIIIGHYRIVARTKGGAAAAKAAAAAPSGAAGWGAWDDPGAEGGGPPPAPASSAWDSAPAAPPAADDAWGAAPAPVASPSPPSSAFPSAPAAGGWGSAPATAAPAGDVWGDATPTAPKSGWDSMSTATDEPLPGSWESAPASAMSGRGPMAQNWSAPRTGPEAAPAQAPAQSPAQAADASDPWGKFAASNNVDWARGGFGDPEPAPAPVRPPPPVQPAAPVAPRPVTLQPALGPQAGAPVARPAPMAAPAAPPPAASARSEAAWAAFLTASGMTPDMVKSSPAEAAAAAGVLLKRLVSGLVVMMEARARAKAQLGAQSTTLELAGNNPLKFARTPDKVLAQLLNPPERGFMDAERAVADSFQDLQAHQMATLAAMQGALRSTLERFSPEAIRNRAETRGVLARILPSAKNSALWEAYQREFEGVARGSDEAFLDVFAKAFKAAYEQAAADMKRGGR